MKRGASSERSDRDSKESSDIETSRPSKKPRIDSDFYKFVASVKTVVADFLTDSDWFKLLSW